MLLVIAVAASLVLPASVMAGHGGADCSNQHDDSQFGVGDFYVGPDGGIWEEANDKAGLQTTAEDCDDDDNDDLETTIPADTQIL